MCCFSERVTPLLNHTDMQRFSWDAAESKYQDDDGPHYLLPEEQKEQRHEIFHTAETKALTANQLRKEICKVDKDRKEEPLPTGKGCRDALVTIAQQLGIETSKVVGEYKTVDKTIADMTAELNAKNISLPSGNLTRAALQDRMKQHGLDIQKQERRIKTYGWVGRSKGLRQVLWETGWIDPEQASRYHKNPTKADKDENDNVKDECRQFVLSLVMADRADFKNEPSDLEDLAAKMSDGDKTVTVAFTPKYHPNIAGEGIEDCWGFSKKYLRRMPMSRRRNWEGFIEVILEAMSMCNPARCMRFRRRCRKYMLGYMELKDSVVVLEEGKTAKSFKEQLDEHVNGYYKPTDEQSKTRRRRKMKAPSKKARVHFAKTASKEVIDAYQAGLKRIKTVEMRAHLTVADRLEMSRTEEVDMEKIRATKQVHRSNLDTGTASIENELELCLGGGDGATEDSIGWGKGEGEFSWNEELAECSQFYMDQMVEQEAANNGETVDNA